MFSKNDDSQNQSDPRTDPKIRKEVPSLPEGQDEVDERVRDATCDVDEGQEGLRRTLLLIVKGFAYNINKFKRKSKKRRNNSAMKKKKFFSVIEEELSCLSYTSVPEGSESNQPNGFVKKQALNPAPLRTHPAIYIFHQDSKNKWWGLKIEVLTFINKSKSE
ncbi:hypothetical protein Fot_28635 [Forsythia ovata]|uniref:Uncharacterized protein n=1 Tax=Forsythia ovata TaxID=205694 RepID=A0ABD1TPJ4_9LAMI